MIGGLPPPLGIALRADGISAVMLIAAAVIVTAAAFYAREKFATPDGVRESRSALTFWTMLQAIWAALTIIFVGGDLFNLYVALELLTFAAVPLVCIDGRPETLAAALRYLLFALFGSISYLLGVALFYGAYGTLDISLLAQRVQAYARRLDCGRTDDRGPARRRRPFFRCISGCLRSRQRAGGGKCRALRPGCQRLILSYVAAVVLHPSRPPHGQVAAVLGWLGAAAVIVGSIIALRQARLKLLIAYSTVAQIGYLFLVFPLAAGAHAWSAIGWSAGLMQVLAHAFAKAAMFFSAGVLAEALGHDQIARLGGAARVLPLTFLTIALGGCRSWACRRAAASAAKWLMLQASVASGQWFWTLPILAGGLLAAGYVYRILAPRFIRRRKSRWNSPPKTQPGGGRACSDNDRPCARLRAADFL